jgi:hypothetical protein
VVPTVGSATLNRAAAFPGKVELEVRAGAGQCGGLFASVASLVASVVSTLIPNS